MDNQFYILKYQRSEYGKKIRKQYEAGEIQERRCNMREVIAKPAEYSNTLTSVLKDNMIIEKVKKEKE
jgi:DNA (cytosine-5)-methyltransferase 3A